MTDWHSRFLDLAEHIATWSKDPSTKVGSVIVNPETKIVVGMGYNGFPRSVIDFEQRYHDRELKYKLIVHAEMNAILNANGLVKGCWLYTSPTIMDPNCCSNCAKFIIQAGITKIFGYKPKEFLDRWKEDSDIAKIMIKEAGIEMIFIEKDI